MRNNIYYISEYESKDDILLSAEYLIEGYDFLGMGHEYTFILSDVIGRDFNSAFLINKKVTLFNLKYEGRFEISFLIKDVLQQGSLLYLFVTGLESSGYNFGAMSVIQGHNLNSRIWLDMKGNKKKNYISASYIFSGQQNKVDKNEIIIEGKYIQDYYSFYCELGYAFFGKFGYMGENYYSCEECLELFSNLKIIWNDSELALKSMNNTIPHEIQFFAEDWLSIVDENSTLILK